MNRWLDLLSQIWLGRRIQHVLDQLEAVDNQGLISEVTESISNNEYFVFLEGNDKNKTLSERTATSLSEAGIHAKPTQFYGAINGFLIELTPSEAKELRQIQDIKSVEADRPMPMTPPVEIKLEQQSRSPLTESSRVNRQRHKRSQTNSSPDISLDRFWTDNQNHQAEQQLSKESIDSISALPVYNNGTASSGDVLPYGVKAVWGGQDISTQGNAGNGSYAFVIDSGVLNTTGDLNLNSTWSKSWISGESAFSDGIGHGTHVAGTIAALANGKGVVGVAPGAEVISLKVFSNSGGGGSYSSILSAINHAVEVINSNGLDKSKTVVNMSLGGGFSSGLDTAVKNAADQGIKFAIAAGNSGSDADNFSPASAGDHPNVYTVSAVDKQYQMSSWSNWDDPYGGDDVDVAAPGVSVLSYYQGGILSSLSGTSMAAPHVAGLQLMGGVKKGAMVTANSSGQADPFALINGKNESPTNPAPKPDPPPPPTDSGYLYLGSAKAGETIVISNENGSISQGDLENKLQLKKGILSTNLNGLKRAIEVSEGSAFQYSGTGKAGDKISFEYNFESKDWLPYADFAFYSIGNKVFSLAELGTDTTATGNKAGKFAYTLSDADFISKNSNTFKFTVGIVDAIDQGFDSSIAIKNFSINQRIDLTNPANQLGSNNHDVITGGDHKEVFYGYLGNDTINGGSGRDTALFSSRNNKINLNTTKWQNTGDGRDRLISIENVKAGSGHDVVTGNRSANTLNGQNGNDRLYGYLGNDTINGGNGNDYLHGGSGRDTAQFSSRSNRINLNTTKWQNTGDGKDRLISIENVNAGSGHDIVTGNRSANTLNGQNGNDRLYGGGGNDVLNGGSGKNRVWGQGGRDTFRVQRASGYTIIEDFTNGQDRIQLGSGASGLQLKNRGDDVYLYQRGDLMAVVEDAAGDLQRSGSFLV